MVTPAATFHSTTGHGNSPERQQPDHTPLLLVQEKQTPGSPEEQMEQPGERSPE